MEDLENEEISEEPIPVTAETDAAEAEQEEATYKEISPMRLVMRRFFRSKLSIVGIVMIAFLFLFSFFGPVVYQRWGESEIDYTPSHSSIETQYTYIGEDGEEITVVEVIDFVSDTNQYAPPSATHLLGTDNFGMDVFVRLMYGGRISLLIGFIVVILETIIGIVLGGLAGYFGGWVDMVIMRIIDIGVCIPELVYITLMMLFMGSGPMAIILTIGMVGWMGSARFIRGRVMQFKNREFVLAAKTQGASPLRQIFRYILPNILGQQVVSITAAIPGAIFMEAYLSFIGLGIKSPMTSWGQLSQVGASFYRVHPYQLFIPGALISVTILAFYLFGNCLRDALDPHLRD